MAKGSIVSGVIAALALVGVLGAFLNNASPYAETIAEARQSRDDRLHLVGDIVQGTVFHHVKRGYITFQMKDAKGEVIHVEHHGEPPTNMGEATRIVAIGRVEQEKFISQKLLIKCPSRYEGEGANAVQLS